jgi:DNA topoisomerase I
MAKHLVIVESPAKAKTINKYLGSDYEVLASYGHVRDLIPKNGAVDPDNHFAMHYDIIEKNQKHVQSIAKALKSADILLLATDPDREGEAIAWAIAEIMKDKKLLKDKPVKRVVFHQITKSAIQEAIQSPRDLDMNLVDAQQARRALDYLVGFNLSPLLWKKIKRGLSAGRVQSPALRLIVEREIDIENFNSQEYWSIKSLASTQNQAFDARLMTYNHQKVEQFSFTTEAEAHEVKDTLLAASAGSFVVNKVDKKQRKRHAAPPFTTSTLQQEAARKLGFTTDRTMRLAQQLYEGIDIGEGATGLITYMRTDSVNLATEAITELRDYIATRYGKDYVPVEANVYKTKSKNAQEAHEAIRPTSIVRRPEEVAPFLTKEQSKLYELIWKRTIASQMIYATMNTVSIELMCGNDSHLFRANGQTIAHPGFITVYQEDVDDLKSDESDDKLLPEMHVGDKVVVNDILATQHFTEPPPRFSEASLVKTLEEFGIGRPSTYASIIYTLQHREYVTLDKKRFMPTDIGKVVNKFLTHYFTQYVDYHFTANLEDQLDAVARGEKQWVPLLEDFWSPFKNKIEEIETSVTKKEVTTESIDEVCPQCGKPLIIRLGKIGRFIACTGYPECKYTRSVEGDGQESTEPEVLEGRQCPACQSPLLIRQGRYGKFIGCSQYPTCKHIEPLEKPQDTEVKCPECHQGNILKRKSRYGKIFYSCSRYPDCKYAIWYAPIKDPCPTCQWPITMLRITKRWGTQRACPQKACKFAEPYESSES